MNLRAQSSVQRIPTRGLKMADSQLNVFVDNSIKEVKKTYF